MINPGNGSQWGIKLSGTDITADIHDIIDNANDFVVVCGYNFSPYGHPSSIIPRLIAKRNAGVAVLLIMPPRMWGFGNTNHTLNIQHLVSNRIGVILNSNNHSKWIISDYGYYYGSLNFTASSMKSKIEVISICNTLRQPWIPWWMTQTKKELLQFAVAELRHFNTVTATMSLGAVNARTLTTTSVVLGLILRYNPEIDKVRRTLLNYEEVRLQLSSIIDSYFPLIELNDLNRLWQLTDGAIRNLDRLAILGNEVLLMHESDTPIDKIIIDYNRVHSRFVLRVNQLIDFVNRGLKERIKNEMLSYNLEIEGILLRHFKQGDQQ